LSKSPYSTLNFYNCILIFSFCLMSLIAPKFHNHVFYVNFGLNFSKAPKNVFFAVKVLLAEFITSL